MSRNSKIKKPNIEYLRSFPEKKEVFFLGFRRIVVLPRVVVRLIKKLLFQKLVIDNRQQNVSNDYQRNGQILKENQQQNTQTQEYDLKCVFLESKIFYFKGK